MDKTIYCGKVTEDYIDQEISLFGWVHKRRDLGGKIFIDLRDRSGLVQVVFDGEENKEALATAEDIRKEYVIEVTGKVVYRQEGASNPDLATGKLEIEAGQVHILNQAKTPPFEINDDKSVSEELRLKYRYLDLRREKMTQNLVLRHQVKKVFRNYLDRNDFIDVETPFLTKSTPEGARDYLVPSRIYNGKFFALPQSPQLFKQLLMGAGLERYYQIVRCFRDEDLRGDRQPEFTQVDIETSFMDSQSIQDLIEGLLKEITKEVKGIEIKDDFPRLTYAEAMDRFGSDKPDIRFGLELEDVSGIVKDSDFKVFASAIEAGGLVKAINAKGGANHYTRKQIDKLQETTAVYGAKGLAWLKVNEDGLAGPIAKFFNDSPIGDQVCQKLGAEPGDLLLFVADQWKVVHDALGALRLQLGQDLGLIDQDQLAYVWVVDWPLLEFDEEEGRYVAAHHPFTMPVKEDVDKLADDPQSVTANAYDIVLNGYEIGGGSIRIHERELQETMLKALGFSQEEAQKQFGFLLDALDYGFPPHGGIAFGLDRLVMILAGEANIREVIAFPKNKNAKDPLTDAPASVSEKQLEELGLSVTSIDQEESSEEN
ncbi:Aspartate--tRNA ligase [Alloiococcus otitis]|mgnify:FL=1|uniref:Aspartate--tRNA(Asp/Asn) ligase n=1 Tax=Alloiococcus otitis ATCC 51267 TaxID=883081 RepID=K9EEM6_9LACT|nr:aspartate--tRNA ligase [Alloiococcus otitis]EKU94306.1 aspartate-tRNA ligase [Alloiococcus otitis ATCC 51267]SUU81060.1 Aspartate--tRNA ligase [Alloiococcus otitis]